MSTKQTEVTKTTETVKQPEVAKTDPLAPLPQDTPKDPVTGPGPTSFGIDPARPPLPDEEARKNENTTREDVGALPDRKATAERIVRHWDGGERIIAARIAQEASKAEVAKAVKARPELQTYIAGDVP